jgi:hypothetical protein
VALDWPIDGEDVCTALGWDLSRATEVADYALAAVSRVEEEVGPWHGQALTHRRYLRTERESITLPWPVATITAVTVDAVAVTVEADVDAGILEGTFRRGQLQVTATARTAADVPDDVVLAARYLAAFWAKQEKVGNPARSSARGNDPDTDVLQGFAMPRRVSEMLRPHIPSWGFA